MIRTEINGNNINTSVLIVGGGITGLSAALFLQQQHVPYLLVERHKGTAILPKARTIDLRAMELFRELGLSDILREAGKAMAPSWGILHGHNLADTLDHTEQATTRPRISPSQMEGMQQLAAQSPESTCRCTQDLSEAVLHATALERGGDLRFHHEMIRFTQDEQQVTAMIRNRETGLEQQVTADYMIAADGANSPVRTELKVAVTGVGTLANFLNIFFEADLAEFVKGREFSQFLVREPGLTGFLLSINNSNRWAFHLEFHPEAGEKPEDYPETKIIAILKKVIGLSELPIRILSILPWPLAVRIAEQLQFGRIFLAGDAAHTMTPYAGKGANTGVQDVHNLAWKLGAVIRSGAGNSLLKTYNKERQPIGAYYARLSGEMAASDGLADFSKMTNHDTDLIGLPNYKYTSDAIIDGLDSENEAHYFTAQPGTRLPHVWLDELKQQSTLDWIKGRFILVVSGARHHWEAVSGQITNLTDNHLPVYDFADKMDREVWQKLTRTQPGDALLIRPDGFIACRLSSADTAEWLRQKIRMILALV